MSGEVKGVGRGVKKVAQNEHISLFSLLSNKILPLQGELCVKTCQLMCGYRGRQGNATDAEGFFHTGDLGFYDKDGAIHFVEQVYKSNIFLICRPLLL